MTYPAFAVSDARLIHRPRRTDFDALLDHAECALNPGTLAWIESATPPRPHERKYLDTSRWLEKLWHPVEMLGLARSRPLRILDLGTGAGHFPFICRFLGHGVVGLDRGDSPFFKAMTAYMGVATADHPIRPFEPLPDFGRRFDIVTAFRIGFNVRPDRTVWDLPEWSFFLDNIAADILRPGGTLCLKFNVSPNRDGRNVGDPALRDLFAAHGAALRKDRRYVVFDPLRTSRQLERLYA